MGSVMNSLISLLSAVSRPINSSPWCSMNSELKGTELRITEAERPITAGCLPNRCSDLSECLLGSQFMLVDVLVGLTKDEWLLKLLLKLFMQDESWICVLFYLPCLLKIIDRRNTSCFKCKNRVLLHWDHGCLFSRERWKYRGDSSTKSWLKNIDIQGFKLILSL